MFFISYAAAAIFTAAVFLLTRLICFLRRKTFSLRREAALFPVLIAILVVLRFTFFPFDRVDGRIQPLVFDAAKLLPLRINLIPFRNLFDYPDRRQILLNIIGNTAMFVPIGVIWPAVYRKLDSHKKAIAAGIGFSLAVEFLQLPFFARVTDVDDLILNTAGYLAGYGMYLLIKKTIPLLKRH